MIFACVVGVERGRAFSRPFAIWLCWRLVEGMLAYVSLEFVVFMIYVGRLCGVYFQLNEFSI
jgi:hypothetical protein